jgi:DNA-binding beta-propeller fold protein YncE
MSGRYRFIAVCALALIVLVGAAGAATPIPVTQYHFVTKWGCSGTGDGRFDGAGGIALDGDGHVYVAEGADGNRRIQTFTSDGTFITKWGTGGGFNLDVDPVGTVYLSEGGMIKRYTANGSPITTWGPYETGLDLGPIAVDGTGFVFVLAGDSVLKIDGNGTIVGRWEIPGEYAVPLDIDVDSAGNVYVVDMDSGIIKFTADGTYITKIEYYYPFRIAIDTADDIWVTHKHGVSKVTPSGADIGYLELQEGFSVNDIGVNGAGNVYTMGGNLVMKWAPGAPTPTPTPTPSPLPQYHFVQKWGTEGSPPGEFSAPGDIAGDDAGHLYVADTGMDRVQKFTSSGEYLLTWGDHGTGEGLFDRPSAIAVDGAGNVYVVDSGNQRVQKFSSDGVFIAKWGSEGTGNGQFDYPTGVAVDAAGSVYVVEEWGNRVQKFTANGTFIDTWGRRGSCDGYLEDPTDIAVDPAGTVYVADTRGVQRFTPDGEFVSWIAGLPGSRGIEVDEVGRLYAISHDEVMVYSSAGILVTAWGSRGTGDGRFNEPSGIAVDGIGNVYVADTGNNRIQKFAPGVPTPAPTPTGPYRTLVIPGRIEAEDYDLGGEGVAYHDTTPGNAGGAYRNDDVDIEYVDSEVSNSVGWIRNGEWLTYTATVRSPGSWTVTARVASPNSGCRARLAVDGSATSTISIPNTGSYSRFTTVSAPVPINLTAGQHVLDLTFDGDGQNLNWLAFGIGTPPPSEHYRFVAKWGPGEGYGGQYVDLEGVGVDGAGNVHVSFASRVQKFTSSGVFITSWSDMVNPRGIAFDRAGAMYVTEGWDRNQIRKYSPSGVFDTTWGSEGSGDGQFTSPQGITIDNLGNVCVADTSNHRIQTFTASGAFITKWGRSGGGNLMFFFPNGVAADGAGNVYVADTSNHRVQKYTSSGVFVTKWGSEGSGDGQFESPHGIAVDSDGNVYVVDTGNNRIQKFTPSGSIITKWGDRGSGDGQFESPHGIAVDSAGNVYVVDTGNNRFQKFAPGGPTPTPAAGPYRPHTVPGRIEVEDYDIGGEGVAYHDTTPGNTGGAYRQDDVDIERFAAEGSPSVGWVRNGEWLTYTATISTAGTYTMKARVANPNLPRRAVLSVDGVQKATITVPTTGSFGKFATVQVPVTLPAGSHTLRLAFSGDGQNWNWIEFSTGGVTTPTTQTPGAGAGFVAAPTTAPHGSAVKFTVTPAAGKKIGAAWWTFDSVGHYTTWNSRTINPTFYYPRAGTFGPLVKLTYADGSTETVARTDYIRVT